MRELELELDAFEGPFDLLLTLLLKEELEPREIDIAAIVVAFVEHMAARDELDLEACGEFLVLVSALLDEPFAQPAGGLLHPPVLRQPPGELLRRLLGLELGKLGALVREQLPRLDLEQRGDEDEELAARVEVDPVAVAFQGRR